MYYSYIELITLFKNTLVNNPSIIIVNLKTLFLKVLQNNWFRRREGKVHGLMIVISKIYKSNLVLNLHTEFTLWGV